MSRHRFSAAVGDYVATGGCCIVIGFLGRLGRLGRDKEFSVATKSPRFSVRKKVLCHDRVGRKMGWTRVALEKLCHNRVGSFSVATQFLLLRQG